MKKTKVLLIVLLVALFVALVPNIVNAAGCEVKFIYNDGSNPVSVIVDVGETVEQPADPTTRDGYTFAGWSLDATVVDESTGEREDALFNFSQPITEPTVTLVGNWVKNYTVTFNGNGIAPNEQQTVPAGSGPSVPNFAMTTIDGYRVIGFYYDADFTTLYAGQVITRDTEIFAKWEHSIVDDDTEEDDDEYAIKEINITVALPKPGDVATIEEDETGDYAGGYYWPSAKPQLVITVPDDAHYYPGYGYEDDDDVWTYWLMSLDEDDYNNPFIGTFEAGKTYYAEIVLATDDYDHYFAEDVVIKVNGEEVTKVYYNDYDCISFGVAITIPLNEYEMKKGAGQVFDNTGDSQLTFEADIDYAKFQESGKVFVDDEEVDPKNYESREGSTIITFSKEYSKALADGEHTIRIAVADGEAKADFTVGKISNPPTGDNITLFIALFVLATIGVAVIIKK